MEELKGMSGKERFDVQMRFVDFYRDRCGARMGNGWKISLGLWSSLGLLIGALITNRVSIGNDNLTCFDAVMLVVTLVVVFGVYFWWIWKIGYDNRQDSKDMHTILESAVEELEISAPKRVKFVYYSQIFQTVITAVLLGLVWFAYRKATAGQDEPTLIQSAQALKQCAQALMESAEALMQSAQLIMEKTNG